MLSLEDLCRVKDHEARQEVEEPPMMQFTTKKSAAFKV